MFDAFLSYSRSDEPAAQKVAEAQRSRELRPFFDRWHLAASQPWQDVLAEKLRQCGAVVVCLGPLGLGSWQNREVQFALNRQAGERGFPVIPLLLPGNDDPALDFLGLNTWVDFREGLDDPGAAEALVRAIAGEPPGPDMAVRDVRAELCPYRGLQQFRGDVSVSLNKLGDLQLRAGYAAAALAAYEESLEIFRRLAETDPANAQWQTDVVVSLWKMSSVSQETAALRFLEEALAIVTALEAAGNLHADQETWSATIRERIATLAERAAE